MSLLYVAVVLAATPEPSATFASAQEAADYLVRDTQTGTLIFSKGDCLAIKVFSGGPYTHVAGVVFEKGEAVVYDSMNGAGVRRQSLKDYLESQNPDVIHVAQPTHPLTQEQSRAFHDHLERELGRPYDVAHHLTGRRAKGLHCSEYMTDALMACNLIHANAPSRVSPASLAEGIIGDKLYTPTTTFAFVQPVVEVNEGANWCERLWIDTKTCTKTCCTKMRRMFLCR